MAPGRKTRQRSVGGKLIKPEPIENEIENTPPEDGSGRKAKRSKKATDTGRGRGGADQDAPQQETRNTACLTISQQEKQNVEKKVKDYQAAAVQAQMNSGISSSACDQLAAVVVREMLFRQRRKPDVPVKREDLTKAVAASPAASGKRNASVVAIAMAQAVLAATFGMEMKKIDLSAPKPIINRGKVKDTPAAPVPAYVLRCLCPEVRRAVMVEAERREPEAAEAARAFRFAVLLLLHVSGGEVAEGDLWRHLSNLCVNEEEVHPLLGKPLDLIATMITQKQLTAEKTQGPDGTTVRTFTMGENAKDEVGEEKLETFAQEIFSKGVVPTTDEPGDEAADADEES